MMYTCRMKLLPFVALAPILLAAPAWADEAPESLSKDMRAYYAGEARSAYVVLGLGAASIGSGAALVTRDGDFARGLGWPLLTLGALETIGAIFYALQVRGELAHVERSMARDPAVFRREELSHIHGTTSRFVFYRLAELGLSLGGAALAAYGFASDEDLWKGAGIGLAGVGLPFLLIDTINQGRAARYEGELRRFEAPVARRPTELDGGTRAAGGWVGGPPSTPCQVSFGGVF